MSQVYRGEEARSVWNGKTGDYCNLEYSIYGIKGPFLSFQSKANPSFGDYFYRVKELNNFEQKQSDQTDTHSGNKYHRRIRGFGGQVVTVDVYRVLNAFNIHQPGLQHAIKKLLCAGIRGKGDQTQDLTEAIDAVKATIDDLSEIPKDED